MIGCPNRDAHAGDIIEIMILWRDRRSGKENLYLEKI